MNAVLAAMPDHITEISTKSMSDRERELHIRDLGWLIEDSMARYYETSCLTHRGDADRFRLLMEEAIRGRSQEQVARLEKERGLS
jgi:hypothetical protein